MEIIIQAVTIVVLLILAIIWSSKWWVDIFLKIVLYLLAVSNLFIFFLKVFRNINPL